MLHAHSTIAPGQRPPHDAIAPIPASRHALGHHTTIDECRAVSSAMVELVALRNNALIAGPFDGGAHLHLLVDGWAYRAYGLPDGGRQITDVMVPGDLCDWIQPEPNAEIRASGPVRVAVLRRSLHDRDLQAFSRHRERAMADDIRRLRALLTSLGRRDAHGRVSYGVAALHHRLERIGLVRDGTFACPLTQEQLGDLLGLTSVHVNRVLNRLRRDGVLMFAKRQVTILDRERLHAIAGWQADVDAAHAAVPDRVPFVLPRDGAPMPPSSATPNSRGLS